MVPAPKLTYKDPLRSVVFSGDELETTPMGSPGDGPELGRLITVELNRSVDNGEIYFSLLLPSEAGQGTNSDQISTTGITSHVPGPDSPVKRTIWQVLTLWGTYSGVES